MDAFDLAADDEHYIRCGSAWPRKGPDPSRIAGRESHEEDFWFWTEIEHDSARHSTDGAFRVYRPGRRTQAVDQRYDPVAYFTDGKPVQGKTEIEYLWHKLAWRFASEAHREMFTKNPDHYAPQYDGYCAMGVSNGDAAHKDSVDPEAWAIVDGKLYLTHNKYWLGVWQEHSEEYIKQADASWQALADRAEPAIVGPPCASSPPTTKVALRDGGYWVVVGGQVARDEAGKIVGKGDLRARSSKSAKMSTPVSMPAARRSTTSSSQSARSKTPPNSRNTPNCAHAISAHLRTKSATVPVPQLTDPDLLLQVEAFAAIK